MKPLSLAIPGLVLLSWSWLDQSGQFVGFLIIGVELIIAGIALVLIAKPSYAIQIGSQSGTDSILRSTDQFFIQRIADAMKVALGRKG